MLFYFVPKDKFNFFEIWYKNKIIFLLIIPLVWSIYLHRAFYIRGIFSLKGVIIVGMNNVNLC